MSQPREMHEELALVHPSLLTCHWALRVMRHALNTRRGQMRASGVTCASGSLVSLAPNLTLF